MSKVVQQRGGDTTDHAKFTGAEREITIDTTKNTVVVHDGKTTGGYPLAKEADLSTIKKEVAKKLEKETVTSLSLVSDVLKYTDESGKTHEFSLSKYIDDTNLSRITSGTINDKGIATFKREDDSSFEIDMSRFLDDTKLTADEIVKMGFAKSDLSNVDKLPAKVAEKLKGDKGDTGAKGAKGDTGAKGAKGDGADQTIIRRSIKRQLFLQELLNS